MTRDRRVASPLESAYIFDIYIYIYILQTFENVDIGEIVASRLVVMVFSSINY